METLKLDGIKNIIFDLGGVILNIDYEKTINEFKKLGVDDFQKIFSQAEQNKISEDFEKGLIPEEKFYQSILSKSEKHFTKNQFKLAWNAMLLDFPLERLKLLKRIKEKYRIFLLSNTNETHLMAFYEQLEKIYGVEKFKHLFERVYYSHLIKLRKPNTEVYNYVMEENSLKKEETLFIDDSIKNVEGALKSGIHAFCIYKNEVLGFF